MRRDIFKNIIVFVAVVSCAFNSFASNKIIQGGIDAVLDDGPGAEFELIVAGDSYAERFYYDERNRGMILMPFFQEGQSIEENWEMLFDAFTAYKKMIFLSISVNDRHRNTHPSVFENELRNLFAIAMSTKKYVFVHSYMYYDLGSVTNYAYSPAEYDAMIRKLIMEFPGTVYFIDMSDCVGSEYMLPDGIHYNKKFNDIMYDRIMKMIDLIKENKK